MLQADLYLWLSNPDPDPALFVSDHLDAKKKNFLLSSYTYSFLQVNLHHNEVAKQ